MVLCDEQINEMKNANKGLAYFTIFNIVMMLFCVVLYFA